MWRAVWLFLIIALIASAIAWFADRPGAITIDWLGYRIETSLIFGLAVIAITMAILLAVIGAVRRILGAPGAVSGFLRHRKQQKGYAALSQGMIALGAGDRSTAVRNAAVAEKLIPGEPLTLLLKAQTAQINGDESTAGRVFRAMLQAPETEALGLRGLFVQARREKDAATARALAERALALKPDLQWASRALLSLQSMEGDWRGAERTLESAREHRLIDKADAVRQRAVLLTARALEVEDDDPEAALTLAIEAHRLAPALVPAAVIAGRILAAKGDTRKAARILEKTWKLSPHPDIAEVYASARSGDSPRDRLKRVRMLVQRRPDSIEGPVAIARAAIDAGDWALARETLKPLLAERPQSRVCTMMAEIEDGEHGDRGRARQWLARAVHAPRDPMWTADGFASETWAPVSPITGVLDAFEWKVPVEGLTFHGVAEIVDEAEAEDEEPETLPMPGTPDETPTAAAPPAQRPAIDAPSTGTAAAGSNSRSPITADGAEAGTRRRSAEASADVVTVVPPIPDDPGPEPEPEDDAAWFRKPVAD